MRRFIGSLAALTVALVVVLGVMSPEGTEAAPNGAATGLRISQQSCATNGTVSATLAWSPSGRGQQTVNLARSSSFSPTSTGGPYSSSASSVGFTQLTSGTTYFARVLTQATSGVLASDTFSFVASCTAGSFSPPVNLQVSAIAQTSAVFTWSPGNQTTFYCVDAAKSANELFFQNGSFTNFGSCGMTGTALGVSGLQCGTTYFARVWGWKVAGGFQGGHSPVVQFTTQACSVNFTPPANVSVGEIKATTARVSWTRGSGNDFSCVDTAQNVNDLFSQSGTFRNFGCGTTSNAVNLSELKCDTRYFVRVWAWKAFVTGGYSPVVEFKTAACPVTFAPPTDLDVDDITQTTATVSWDAGAGNLFYCVDLAENEDDLESFSDTFRNFGCGTTSTEVELTGLDCNTDYVVRVYAWRPGVGAAYSEIEDFDTAAC